MSVTQVHEALGSFEFELLGNVPRDVLDGIDYFSHIAIIPGRMDPRQYGDGCLAAARYVGVVRSLKIADDGRTNLVQDDIRVGGVGMEFWLGDDDNKGAVLETLVEFTEDSFFDVISALKPDAVDNGTIYSVSGSYSGRHQYETPRSAIQYVCQTMSTETIPLGYKVSNDGKLSAGPISDLFVTDPVCIILRKGGTQGEDMFLRALPSTVDLDQDMEDFSTRVVMLAESNGESLATGAADIDTIAPGVNTFKDLFGNPLVLTRLVSESDTIEQWADTRAELALRDVITAHRTLTISAEDYDIHGTFEVGDYIYVYDPDSGLFDPENEVMIRGVRINPLKLQVTESDWPITEGYTVAHRSADGEWRDLTDYIHWEETQPSKIVVGEFNRELVGSGESVTNRLGSLTPADNSIPAQMEWIPTSFQTVNYLDGQGNIRARQKLVWETPLNTDGTAIQDGSHYEIQYKLDTGSQYSQTWAASSLFTWDELNQWNQPVEPDDVQYQTLNVPWGENTTVIHELPVGTGFDSRIRAVDKGANQGEWSLTETWITHEDDIPPSPPAAPAVAGNPLNIQVIHELGKASGGTFNLENDLAFIEVHYSQDEGFFPSATSLAGRLRADRGMMSAETAAIGSFPIPETSAVYVKVVAVDMSGNKSSPSAAAQVTAELIDSQYVSELTASKISAGDLSAEIIISGAIKTAESGQRVELNSAGLQAYDENGDLTTNLSASTSATGEYISFRNSDGATVASIADTGDAAFTNVYADEELYVGGNALTDTLSTYARGMLAVTTVQNASPGYTGTPIKFGQIIIPDLDGTRQYAVGMSNLHFDRGDNNTIKRINIDVRVAFDRAPTMSDTLLTSYQHILGPDGYNADQNISMRHPFNNPGTEGTDYYIAFFFYSEDTTGDLRVEGGDSGRFYVEDTGPAVTYGTFDLATEGADTGEDGGGGSGGQQFTKSYSSTWTRSYQSDGDLRISNGDMYQGRYDSTNGDQRSLVGFDETQIQADLSGATIVKVELTLNNEHFYFNGGGTVRIGTHSYSSAPGSWSGGNVNENRDSFSWSKGSKKTVTLEDSIGTDFKSGSAKGIAIGPGESSSLTYYSRWSGQNSSSKPVLKITYNK